MPNGKSIIFQNKLYVANANNRPQLVATNGSKNEIARFTSTTTWTCPDGVYNVDVWVCGAGGGGASGTWGRESNLFGRCGSGGCGGECIMYRNIDVFPQTSYSIVIGAGGAGGVAAAAVGETGKYGSNGGNSYFANTNYLAKGGSGGSPYSNRPYEFIGTGVGGNGSSLQVTMGSTNISPSAYGRPGGYTRTDYPDFVKYAVSGTVQLNGTYTYNTSFSNMFNIAGDKIERYAGKTCYSGFNPYDGLNYGMGGSGASQRYNGQYDDDAYAAWSGSLHGGYSNQTLYTNPDDDYIHGSVTCGGGGACGGDKGNYPHAAGNGGSGLIIIYG